MDPTAERQIRDYMEARRNAGPEPVIATIRVDLKHREHLSFDATSKEGGHFTFRIDEPTERGGTGSAPTPLNYFLAGAGSCLLTQYAKLAIVQGLRIDALDMTVRGHVDWRIDGAFRDLVYDIRIASPEPEERIRQLAAEAERYCFVHNTLKPVVKMLTNLVLNGQPLGALARVSV